MGAASPLPKKSATNGPQILTVDQTDLIESWALAPLPESGSTGLELEPREVGVTRLS